LKAFEAIPKIRAGILFLGKAHGPGSSLVFTLCSYLLFCEADAKHNANDLLLFYAHFVFAACTVE